MQKATRPCVGSSSIKSFAQGSSGITRAPKGHTPSPTTTTTTCTQMHAARRGWHATRHRAACGPPSQEAVLPSLCCSGATLTPIPLHGTTGSGSGGVACGAARRAGQQQGTQPPDDGQQGGSEPLRLNDPDAPVKVTRPPPLHAPAPAPASPCSRRSGSCLECELRTCAHVNGRLACCVQESKPLKRQSFRRRKKTEEERQQERAAQRAQIRADSAVTRCVCAQTPCPSQRRSTPACMHAYSMR